jgi:hypothetical protein
MKASYVKINTSLDAKLDKAEDDIERLLELKLQSVANDVIAFTMGANPRNKPAIDTGAYIQSFSISSGGAGRPRGKSSKSKAAKQRKIPVDQAADIARSNLFEDISVITLDSSSIITLRNGSPHAEYVEHKHGYKVLTQIRNKHG